MCLCLCLHSLIELNVANSSSPSFETDLTGRAENTGSSLSLCSRLRGERSSLGALLSRTMEMIYKCRWLQNLNTSVTWILKYIWANIVLFVRKWQCTSYYVWNVTLHILAYPFHQVNICCKYHTFGRVCGEKYNSYLLLCSCLQYLYLSNNVKFDWEIILVFLLIVGSFFFLIRYTYLI